MDAENIESSEQLEKKTSPMYLLYVFLVGIASIAVVVYWGFTGFSFLISIAVGGLIQVVFRTTKRMWSNSLNPAPEATEKNQNPFILGISETFSTVKIFASLYAVMVVVSGFWYGIGMLFGWLLN
jgi:uncharacterized membrane protein YjjP (DUF1212 family)